MECNATSNRKDDDLRGSIQLNRIQPKKTEESSHNRRKKEAARGPSWAQDGKNQDGRPSKVVVQPLSSVTDDQLLDLIGLVIDSVTDKKWDTALGTLSSVNFHIRARQLQGIRDEQESKY